MRTLLTANAIGHAIGEDRRSVLVSVCFREEDALVLEEVELSEDGIVDYDEKTVEEIKKMINYDKYFGAVRLKKLFK
ncbi:hypothetical protein [Bacillus thuringiensis]|uniref:Uncharacterized protein n=1 Tax=Bacillus thuringiensis subsp. jegathesan TaxID=56955 RepID=A0A9X6R1H0_BACTJ|nr:hypothetical protein [Bacillus thuringiensis]OUB71854.1 hypothetical protein BK750_09765 [Bacillus thuringiensis serovar jegathesan]